MGGTPSNAPLLEAEREERARSRDSEGDEKRQRSRLSWDLIYRLTFMSHTRFNL